MLKIRVIPTLLWKNYGLVKGVGFNSWRRVGSVIPAIKVYNSRDVDELFLFDITATEEKREPDNKSMKDFAIECSVPFTVGGGINKLSQIEHLLKSGADKISINSYSYTRPEIIKEASNMFGSQCVVASIDAKKNTDGQYYCYSDCGKKNTEKKPDEWAKELEQLGCGEILITSINLDGTRKGYDIKLISTVVKAVSVPVIASGGAGNYDHMVYAIRDGGASAVAAASMFHFTDQTPLKAKKKLNESGIPVRDCYRM